MAAEQGIVKTQAHTIRLATPQRTALNLRNEPTPIMAPVIVWVVLTGMPNAVEINKVMAALNSAQKPSTGLILATFCPIVLTMRHPPSIVPKAMAV